MSISVLYHYVSAMKYIINPLLYLINKSDSSHENK